MLNSVLAGFYERDLRRIIEEINLFQKEENLWKILGSVKNSAGNLALHIIGGTNYLIGTVLANTGYIRDRAAEFSRKNVERAFLVKGLEALIPLVTQIVGTLDMDARYPLIFDDMERANHYVMVQLTLHLNYHLGQVNYLRRILEPEAL
ncbi:MAG TPA: DinB superfamily protein [Niabella sp.]